MSNLQKELDLEAIEATLAKLPGVPRFPAYFNDMRLLVEEVRRLREENERLESGIERFQTAEKITIGKRYFEKVKLPIPISPDVNVEYDTAAGEFACQSTYNDGPPERGVDYEKEGRSFTCKYCPITLSTLGGIEDHIEERHSNQRTRQ
jgi:hypothetical protein